MDSDNVRKLISDRWKSIESAEAGGFGVGNVWLASCLLSIFGFLIEWYEEWKARGDA